MGIESKGEYLDCEIADGQNLEDVKERMNRVSGDGFHILSVRELKENATKVMAAVRFASYQILFDADIAEDVIAHSTTELQSRETYLVHKKTKKKEQDVDIIPQIIKLAYQDHKLNLTLRAGGDQNIKAETVANVLFDLMGIDYHREKITIMRLELFAEDLIPLEDFETVVI